MTQPPLSDKIGYLVSQYPATSHTFIRREVAALRNQGFSIQTYSIRQGDVEDTESENTYNVLSQSFAVFVSAHIGALLRHPVRYLSTLRLALSHRVPGIKALIWALLHFGEAIVLARQLRRDGVTRLHNHFANSAATVGLLATHLEAMPWSLTLHGISEFDYPAGLLLARKLERAQFAACVSWFGMAQAMRLTPPPIWTRFALVRCGIDPHDLPDVHAISAGHEPFNLVCVGRLSPEKGHAGLIGVVAALVKAGHAIQLTLVGSGPEEHALRRLVGELGVAESVNFCGRLDERDTLDEIARADALVSASFMEGLPVVLIEALAMGVPVIASRVAGIPELVREGETGLLFDPGHWADLRGGIEQMLHSPGEQRRLAANGRRLALSEFSYPAAAAPLAALLSGRSADDAAL